MTARTGFVKIYIQVTGRVKLTGARQTQTGSNIDERKQLKCCGAARPVRW